MSVLLLIIVKAQSLYLSGDYNNILHTAPFPNRNVNLQKCAVQQSRAVCAFKFRDPLFTAGAAWHGVLVHAALNNWDCKVNVRRIVKDKSLPPFPPLASLQVSFRQIAVQQ